MSEADEISFEDLKAAGEFYDKHVIKRNLLKEVNDTRIVYYVVKNDPENYPSLTTSDIAIAHQWIKETNANEKDDLFIIETKCKVIKKIKRGE